MEWLHVLFAILAAFRLNVLFTQDAIWQPVRTRFPRFPWYCSLCMSVWGGIAATVFLVTLPWLNWPLGMSWLYLAYERIKKVDNEELNARVNAMQAEYEVAVSALSKRAAMLNAELASSAVREQKSRDRISELEKLVPATEKKE